MGKLLESAVRVAAIIIVTVPTVAPQPVYAQAVSGLLVGEAITQLRSELDNVIQSAAQDMDLVVFNAATEARDAIDAFERANTNLLNRGFDRLSAEQRQLFLNIEKTVGIINEGASDRIAQSQELVNSANQMVASLPLNKKVYINQTSPKLFFPGGTSPLQLRLTGTHLSKARLKAFTSSGASLEMIESTSTSAIFLVPQSELARPDGTAVPLSITIKYLHSPYAWFGKDPSEVKVAPWVMPATMGTFRISATVGEKLIERRMEEFPTGKLSGSNRNVYKGVQPPAGWRFDLERFQSSASVRGDGGEAGRCQQVADEDRSENGVKIQGRVDRIRRVSWSGVDWDDGWIRCIASLPIYREVETTKPVEVGTGQIGWYKAVRFEAPPGLKTWKIDLNTFDGRELVFSGPANDRFLSINADPSGLTITPKRPSSSD